MKPLRPVFLCLGLATCLPTLHALAPIDLVRLQSIKARVVYLYAARDEPPPPVNMRHNPFRIGGEPLATDPRGLPTEEGPVANNDQVLLLQAAATLKIGGVLETGGRMRLAINTVNYAEGDVIQVRLPSGTVFLRVTTITPRSVTLRLNEAYHTLQF